MLISEHAVIRYQERVKPHLSDEAARAELEALTKGKPIVSEVEWHQTASPVNYIVISDGIAALLDPRRRSVVVSVVVRAGCSVGMREHKNRNRAARRYGKRMRSKR